MNLRLPKVPKVPKLPKLHQLQKVPNVFGAPRARLTRVTQPRAHEPFRPLPLLSNAHVQTLLGAYMPAGSVASTRLLVPLADGDTLSIEESHPLHLPHLPRHARMNPATAVLVHGLCGSHDSPYLVRTARALLAHGVHVVRVNLRGAGSGKGLARGLGHAGRSEDLLAVLQYLRQRYPRNPLHVMGFSLGGNIALKLAGELEHDGQTWMQTVTAVCPPTGLEASVRKLGQPTHRPYEQYFVRWLRRFVHERHQMFPDLPHVQLPKTMSLRDFDDVYTAPFSGYPTAQEYYRHASAAPRIAHIRVPTTVFIASDDPFVDNDPLLSASRPDEVRIVHTPKGGHLGYIDLPLLARKGHWLDPQLVQIVTASR
jgi:predicted alpha/beta-fold hydrolase